MVPWLGQDFFPTVDAGSFKLHLRGPTGMRIEDTAFLCDLVEDSIRKQIPAAEVASIIDNIGLPYSGINLSYSNSAPIGTSDADILVTLSPKHHPTDDYVNQLRLSLAKHFPGVMFAFLPSDMVTQILNFGLPAPIDIQVIGNDLEGNRAWASQLMQKIRYVPGTADLRIQQPFDQPYMHLRIERTKAQELGFSAHDIAQNLLVSLSGSFQTSPTFWVDPEERSQLFHCDANASVPRRHAARSREYSGNRHRSLCSAIAYGEPGLHQARNRHGASCRTTTSHR